jgi:hypothetical protein
MSAAADILEELSRRGVAAQADGETIRLKPRAPLDDALLARVKEHKPQILAALSRRRALCSPTCYEIEPGRGIHHPWDGCKIPFTPLPLEPPGIAPVACRHCGGSGKCACVSCGCFEPHAVWKSGRCVLCEVSARARVQ